MASSTRRLLTVFVALLLVTVAWKMLERRRTTSRTVEFADVDSGRVTQIEITGKAGQEVTLRKDGDRWVLTSPVSYPANQQSVADLLEKAEALEVANLVSSNADNHDLYEVGPDTGVLVSLMGGAEGGSRLLSFYVGKLTSDFGHTYVREFGSDDVYTAVGLLQGYFAKNVSAWRDRTILALEQPAIQTITVQSEAVSWTLSRGPQGGPAWLLDAGEGPVPADSTRAAGVARGVAAMSATDFPSAGLASGADWDQPYARITATLADGTQVGVTAVIATGESSKVWVRKDSEETVFTLYKSTLDSILREPEDLLPRP